MGGAEAELRLCAVGTSVSGERCARCRFSGADERRRQSGGRGAGCDGIEDRQLLVQRGARFADLCGGKRDPEFRRGGKRRYQRRRLFEEHRCERRTGRCGQHRGRTCRIWACKRSAQERPYDTVLRVRAADGQRHEQCDGQPGNRVCGGGQKADPAGDRRRACDVLPVQRTQQRDFDL